MTLETYRRPGIPAVLLLAILGLLALWFPKWIAPPALVSAIDAACTDGTPMASPIPVLWCSYWLDRAVASGPVHLAAVMHAHSVLAHLLSGMVLLSLLMQLGARGAVATCGAAVFVVHPMALEAVSIVGFRSLVYGGLFSFLCLAWIGQWGRDGAWRHALVAGACAALAAACSPPVAAVLPGLALLVAVRVGGRAGVALLASALPVLLVTAGYQHWPLALGPQPLAALSAPFASILIPSAPAGLGALPITGAAGAVLGVGVVASLGCVSLALYRRRPALATASGALAVAALPALWSTPLAPAAAGYLVIAGLALALALPMGFASVRVSLGWIAVVCLVVVDWSRDPIYRDAGSLFTAAGASPLAQALLGEHLAVESEDGASQQRAIKLLGSSLPDLPRSPQTARIHRSYVGVLTRQGRAGDASVAAEELCRMAEGLGDEALTLRAYLLAAECLSIENYDARVHEYIDKARALDPDHPEVVAARGEREFAALAAGVDGAKESVWIQADDPRAARIEALADRALSVDAECVRARLLKGRILEARGDVLDALAHYERAIAKAPTRTEPRLLLARLYMDNEMTPEAEQCIRAALSAGVDDPRIHFSLVMVLTAKGQSSDALQYLEVYVRNHSDSRQARVLLASLLSARGLRIEDQAPPEELRQLAARIELLNPEDPKGYLVRAEVLMRSKPPKFENYVKAIVLIENARLEMPDDADVRRRLAIAHRDFGWKLLLASREDLAMDHFQQFLKLAPPSIERGPVLRTYRNHCLNLQKKGLEDLRAGLGQEAAARLQRFTQLLPLRAEGHFQLGLARMEQELFEPALASFERAVELGSAKQEDVSVYILPLLDTLHRMDRPEDARRRAEAFLKDPGPASQEMQDKIRLRISR